ncbi:MAG TPA: selenoneine biosynthesis selenosugar synthase SenB [Acidimicrobiia bacterium]|nr:selenoneine biosynthesis selenosugar synthase SenB [Acidimicrobiia bacterium]
MRAEQLRIRLVTPALPRRNNGNGVTARRWARILRELGHRVVVEETYEGGAADVLVALHARRSAGSIDRFRTLHPNAPIVLALTGTDVYGDIHTSDLARRSLQQASCFVVLQRLAIQELPEEYRSRCHVIHQSAVAPPRTASPRPDRFDLAVLAHLRAVKDPLRAAAAARLLSPGSTACILHAGAALDDDLARQAQDEMASNHRYRWVGDLPRWKALRLLARCRLLLVTSEAEGGANVISEALACSVPVISSCIPGSVGILGADYPGYFTVGEEKELAALLEQAEQDPGFYQQLRDACEELRVLVDPAREREAWRAIIDAG